jgi:Ribonucleases P/MRP protein subunit POP1
MNPNLHISSFVKDRAADTTRLRKLLELQRDSLITSTANIPRRTASYIRHKISRQILRRRKQSRITQQHEIGRRIRTRSVLSKLHDLNQHESKGITRWLETHFWLRKRFHMETKWSFSLPMRHNSRGKKALSSALRDSVLVHDHSYLRQFQIVGDWENVTILLKKFTVCAFKTMIGVNSE